MADSADLQVKLKIISADYAAKLPEKIAQIEQAWEQLPADRFDEENWQNFYRMVHSITGSGKTFGFALLSDVARKLEEYLKQVVQAKAVPDEAQRDLISIMLSELHQVTLNESAARQDGQAAANLAADDESTASRYSCPVSANRIFVVEDDADMAELLRVQLGYYGYEVSVFATLDEFRAAIQSRPDVVVLMDVSFPGAPHGGIEAMKAIQRARSTLVPVIFLTAHDDLATRLEAARAGGIAYLGKPANIGTLVDKLDTLTSPLPAASYRILIVDDSEAMSTYYAALLEHAGMMVKVVNDPLQVMAPLRDFAPDLILLDMYMPGCSGVELAKIIRQMDAFVGIPIVFLSAEGDLDKQLSAIGLGADDFLTKPIRPQHLISSVTSRVRRSLKLRSLMVRDSLTGLLNHTAVKDQLDREMAQVKRLGSPLSFVMVDIDHFKQVNDTYGHPAGDRVIKSLARMLKQRLRETDVVGRYGGEEFAVIMGNTDGATAASVLDAIRENFSRLRHFADGKEFFTTFSCGVADASHFSDATQLCNAADKALYQAKHAGRNQVAQAGAAGGIRETAQFDRKDGEH